MYWNDEAYKILKRELARRKVTYARLQQLLTASGVDETERSIASKVSRGTFSFSFFIQCMRAIGAQQVDLTAVEPLPRALKDEKGRPV